MHVPRKIFARQCFAYVLAVVVPVACASEPVTWHGLEYPAAAPVRAAAADAGGLCRVGATELGDFGYRGGWNSATGQLAVAMSGDAGETWDAAVIVDSRDLLNPACDRPAPSLFADSANGFLHVAYFLEVPGAPGVYYAHSMYAERLEQYGAGMFERPWAVMYGARVARTAVASRGDTVVIAYEDPNSPRGPIQVAISGTAGHSFDRHVSVPGSAGGSAPHVALRAGELTVTWREGADTGRVLRSRGSFR